LNPRNSDVRLNRSIMSNRIGRRKFLLYGSAALGSSLFLKACTQSPTPTPEATTTPETPATPVSSGDTIKVGYFTLFKWHYGH
jgi:secreted PhoX family phosphatase